MTGPPGYRHSPSFTEHLGRNRPYLRDAILGVNDGLVSMLLLVAGVVGGGLTARQVLLTGIAGAIAGAVSMAAGEYMATKSQDELFEGEIALERAHIREHREAELHELRDLLGGIGLEGELRDRVVEHFGRDDESLLGVMTALEFGVVETERRKPHTAMYLSGLLFSVGSLPAVLPFAFVHSPGFGLILAAAGTILGLLIVGAVKTWATRGRPVRAALENLVIAALGGGLAYGVGLLFDHLVG
ncbi:MAG: VIT1/CCC1 transporter family protein [Acidimicrobiia bacterium]|nr:VIT1/CCC1 transporter family protein [Acidimicrobiia bacterium]